MSAHKSAACVRLNKFISASGLCSRRKADELIAGGYVRVNGKIVRELGVQVHPSRDEVIVRGKKIRAPNWRVYVMLNKPAQVMTTLKDPEGRPTVADLVRPLKVRLFPVGRLDWDSEGLLLMTNDGDFAHQVMHPTHGVTKTYLAKLDGQPTDRDLRKLVEGVTIMGGKAKALKAERLPSRGSEKYDWVKIVIEEGRNRQVRRMFEKIGYDVKKLQRVAIGRLSLGNLKKGKYRVLTPDDVKKVFVREDQVREKSTKK